MLYRAAILVLVIVGGLLFSYWQDPRPRKTLGIHREYYCTEDWQPFDIAFSVFDNRPVLYSTDWSGILHVQLANECNEFVGESDWGEPWNKTRGVAADGQPSAGEQPGFCFGDASMSFDTQGTGNQAIRPLWHCWTKYRITSIHPPLTLVLIVEAPSVREFSNRTFSSIGTTDTFSIEALQESLFLTLWDGFAGSIVVIDDHNFISKTTLDDQSLAAFVHPVSDEEFFVTVLNGVPSTYDEQLMSAQHFFELPVADGGSVLHVKQGVIGEVVSGLTYPTGIVGMIDRLFVADYLNGVIRVYSLTGELVGELSGFDGPMGLTWGPTGELCVAEMDAHRVICLPIDPVFFQ